MRHFKVHSVLTDSSGECECDGRMLAGPSDLSFLFSSVLGAPSSLNHWYDHIHFSTYRSEALMFFPSLWIVGKAIFIPSSYFKFYFSHNINPGYTHPS